MCYALGYSVAWCRLLEVGRVFLKEKEQNMGIHTLRFAYLFSDVSNINKKYLEYNVEDENTGWKMKGESWKDSILPDYYINPRMNSWDVKAFYDKEGKAPPGYKVEVDEKLHDGKVIKTEVRCDQVMSDVWENNLYALIHLPETAGKVIETSWGHKYTQEREYVWIRVGQGGYDMDMSEVKIDAPEELKQKYERDEKFYQAEKAHKARMQRRLEERHRINKDSIVEVVSGRKVKKGTFGRVFWFGQNQWGTQLGIALTPEKGNQRKGDKEYKNVYINTQFTSQSNCRVVGAESELNLFLAAYAWEKGREDIHAFIKGMNCPSEFFDKMSSIAEDEEISSSNKKETLWKLFDENSYPE